MLLKYAKKHLVEEVIPLLDSMDDDEKLELFNNELIYKIFFENPDDQQLLLQSLGLIISEILEILLE